MDYSKSLSFCQPTRCVYPEVYPGNDRCHHRRRRPECCEEEYDCCRDRRRRCDSLCYSVCGSAE